MNQTRSDHTESKLDAGETTTTNEGRSNRVHPHESSLKPSKKSQSSNDNEADGTFTIDDAVEYFGIGKFQIMISLFAGLSWVGDPYDCLCCYFWEVPVILNLVLCKIKNTSTKNKR